MWMERHRLLYRRNRLFINMTSLVDILFILLLFLLLSTTFDRSGAFPVNLPRAETAGYASAAKTHELLVTADGRLALDESRFGEEELFRTLRAWPEGEKSKPLLLKADERVPYGKIVHLLDRLRASEVFRVEAVTTNE